MHVHVESIMLYNIDSCPAIFVVVSDLLLSPSVPKDNVGGCGYVACMMPAQGHSGVASHLRMAQRSVSELIHHVPPGARTGMVVIAMKTVCTNV